MHSSTYETASLTPLPQHQPLPHKRDKDCSCASCQQNKLKVLRSLSPLQSIIQEIDEERTVTLSKATINWTGPHSIGRNLNSIRGGGIYVVIRKRKPIYIGQTGSFRQRFNKHFSSLLQMGCDIRQQKIYLGKISVANGLPVTEGVRMNVESVIIRTYLKKAVRLQNRSSVKAFKTGLGGLSIHNKGIDLPPGLTKFIKHPQGSFDEILVNDHFNSAESDYENSWMAELFPDEQFEVDEEFNETSIDYSEQEDELEFRGRRRKRPSRRTPRSLSKLRSNLKRRSRLGKPSGSIKPRFPKPRRRPILKRSRRRPKRRPVIIREPAAPCVCPAHGTEFVRWVQSSLNQVLGLRLRVNGIMIRATRNALRDFQRQENLPIDGIAGPETEKALVDAKTGKSDLSQSTASASELYDDLEFKQEGWEREVRINRKTRSYIRWVQQSLNKVMGIDLKVDGISGKQTRSAIRSFQKRFSLQVDGVVGRQTEAMLIMLGFSVPSSTQIPSVPATVNWAMPASIRAAGEAQFVRYDSPPAWSGKPGNCSESFTPGASQLKGFILSRHPGVSRIGGYNCRVNSANRSQTSVHGVGRALDIMIPTISGRANAAVGDPIANWLVQKAEALGVQYIIWNRSKWNASKREHKHGRYGGPSPHIDHIHVELNLDGARQRTAWYQQAGSRAA